MKQYAWTFIALLTVCGAVWFSGCIGNGGNTTTTIKLEYKNDALTVENYQVTDKEPYVGSITTVSFQLRNNAEYPIERVIVKFDTPGLGLIQTDSGMYCEGGIRDGNSCVWEKDRYTNKMGPIEPLETRDVRISIRAPKLNILQEVKMGISHKISYDYFGAMQVNIPVIDGTTRKTPLAKYKESSQMYGPIKLQFDPPIGRETLVDKKVVREYWGVGTGPFKINMKFTHVGSSSMGDIQDTKLGIGMVNLDLRNSVDRATSGGDMLPCDFDSYSAAGSWTLGSNKEITVPDNLGCSFQSKSFDGPETLASLWVEYNYTYNYIKTDTLTIRPLDAEI